MEKWIAIGDLRRLRCEYTLVNTKCTIDFRGRIAKSMKNHFFEGEGGEQNLLIFHELLYMPTILSVY